MRAIVQTALARWRDDQRGIGLAELLVGIFIALLTAAAAMTVLMSTIRNQDRVSDRAAQIQDGRTMTERVARELRQGESVSNATSSSLEILTYVNSATCGGAPAASAILCRVTYSCTSTACTRTERNPNGTGTGVAEPVVDGIQSSAVFTYSPSAADPSYVGVSLSFPAEDGSEGVTVSDGVAMRNYLEAEPGA